MGAVSQITQGVSDAVSSVGKAIASSPIAQAAITVGGAMMGVPPMVTAGLLGVNQTAQNGDIGAGLMTGGLSYLGGTGVNNYGATGSVFGEGGASGFFGMGSGYSAVPAAGTATEAQIAAMSADQYAAYAAGSGSGAATTGLGGLWNNFANGNLVGTALNGLGGYLNSQAASDAASTQAQAQIRAAQIAADAAKFRPVGVTTNFGASKFGYDANGNLNAAGYALNPLLQGQQNQVMQSTPGLLNQYTGSQAATAPMADAAQRAMTLGNQYLATDPQSQAQKYMADQQALLSGSRATDLATLQARLQATGRNGLMVGGDAGMMAANPEMNAYYNANRQQDLGLAAQATQGGMDYAKFGLGTVGSGGQMLSSMYGVQNAASQPYTNALGVANTIEGMGQNAMDLGTSIGAKSSTGAAQAGQLLGNGMMTAANTIGNQAQAAGSPWGNLLMGGANALSNYRFGA